MKIRLAYICTRDDGTEIQFTPEEYAELVTFKAPLPPFAPMPPITVNPPTVRGVPVPPTEAGPE